MQDGKYTFERSKYRVYIGESVPVGGTAQASFWFAKLNADKTTWTKISESSFSTIIKQGSVYPHEIVLPSFSVDLVKGDIIGRFASSDIKDGFYIQSDSPL